MTKKEKLLLFVLACLNFTHIMDFMIMMPMSEQLISYFNISPRQFSLLVAAYSFSAGVSGFLVAFVADRFPRKHIIMVAYIGFVVGTLACAVAPTYELLAAARILAGSFGGVLGAQVMTTVSDTFAYERRGQAMGVVMAAFSIASVIGIPVGIQLTNWFDWHAPFWAIGGLGVIVIGLIWLFVPRLDGHLKDPVTVQRSRFEVITTIVKTPNQLRALWLTVTIMLGHFSIIPFITPYLTSNLGFTRNDIVLIYFVGGLLTTFTSPLVGKITDKQGKYPVFVVFAILSLIPIFMITNMQTQSLAFMLTVAGLFFIFSNGRLIPTQAMSSSVVLPQQRGGFMSINSSLQLLSQSVAVYLAGLIIEKQPNGHLLHYNWVGYAAMFFIFCSIFIARTIKPIEENSGQAVA